MARTERVHGTVWGRSALGGLALLIAAGAGVEAAAAPKPAGPMPKAGQVRIFRDDWGVPHIYARSEADGYFGLGYALAEDQAARFYLRVLAMRGTLAASLAPKDLPPAFRPILPTTDVMVASDYQARLWGLRGHAEAFVDKLSPAVRANYAAFVRGMDAYAAAHPDKVPAWRPRDLSVADLVALPQAELWDGYQGGIGVADCARGGAELRPPKPVTDQAGAPKGGYSNEWALMPSRTSTGGAVLLSDPHGPIDGRFSYEARIHAGGLHYAGFTVGPLPIVGRNARLGWALTTGSPDVSDCYAIKLEAGSADRYAFDGAPRTLRTTEITIAVLGEAPRRFRLRYASINGLDAPVVAERDGTVFAVSTPYLPRLADFHNIANRLARAETVDAFRAALGDGGFFPQNLLAADSRGDILYARNGLTPVRPDLARDWTRPVPGNGAAFEWKGLHPAADMLVIKSPPSGYIENNNVDPRRMDVVPPPETKGLPEYFFADGTVRAGISHNRPLRFLEAVAGRRVFSEADVRALTFDTGFVETAPWVGLVRAAAPDPAVPFVADLLRFDGRLEKGSTAALKYIYWREALRPLLKLEDVEELRAALGGEVPSPGLLATLRQSLGDAAERLGKAPGGLQRTYGDEFRLPLPAGSLPMSGGHLGPSLAADPSTFPPDCRVSETACGVTLLAAYYRPPDAEGHRMMVNGSRIMQLHLLSPKGIRSFSYQNPGASDDPASPHFADQAEKLVSRQTLKPVLFDWAELRGWIESTETLDTGR